MDAVTRFCSELVAGLADRVGGGVPTLVFLTVLAAVLTSLGWYFWPAWLPWRWHWQGRRRAERRARDRRGRRWGRLRLGRLRWRLPRWRRRRRPATAATPPADLPADALPDLRAEVLTITADQFAEAGRFAEAVRERLRAIVRDLIERDVLPPSPGWTVTELARGAASARPPLATPLHGAVAIFSEIWYGLRPATAADDAAMRAHAAAVAAVLADSTVAAAAAGSGAP
jgi:Domain of unknown function (DUF4129)